MQIELQPETEELLRGSLRPGQTVDEFLDEAVRMLSAQEQWIAKNRREIAEKIDAGWASAKRGELYSESEVRERMRAHKAEFLARSGK